MRAGAENIGENSELGTKDFLLLVFEAFFLDDFHITDRQNLFVQFYYPLNPKIKI